MKKLLSLTITLIFILSMASAAFAEPAAEEEKQDEYVQFVSEWSDGNIELDLYLAKLNQDKEITDLIPIETTFGFRTDDSGGIWTIYKAYNLPDGKLLVEYIYGTGAAGPNGPQDGTQIKIFDVSGDKIETVLDVSIAQNYNNFDSSTGNYVFSDIYYKIEGERVEENAFASAVAEYGLEFTNTDIDVRSFVVSPKELICEEELVMSLDTRDAEHELPMEKVEFYQTFPKCETE